METVPQWVVEVLNGFGRLFSPTEWKAIVIIMVATIAGTHTAKIIWRLSPLQGCNGACINLIAAALGFILSFFVWPSGSWWVWGIISGPLAIFSFKFFFALLKNFTPKFAAFLNADRRSDGMPLPPKSTGERRKPE